MTEQDIRERFAIPSHYDLAFGEGEGSSGLAGLVTFECFETQASIVVDLERNTAARCFNCAGELRCEVWSRF